jgi:putative glutamine amidotransferase
MPHRRRPVIGITSYSEQARYGDWDLPVTLLPTGYLTSVLAAGGRPVVLPSIAADAQDTEDLLDSLDGLILAGGPDIDPARYGADPHPATGVPRPARDEAELGLLHAALARDLPLLGICRGAQLMAVATGGTLIQHLPDVVGHADHRPTPGAFGDHDVRIAAGSRLAGVLGTAVGIRAYHHQAVEDSGSFTVCAWARDGTIEALEDPLRGFCLGVQWHPEAADDGRLFAALISAALIRAA